MNSSTTATNMIVTITVTASRAASCCLFAFVLVRLQIRGSAFRLGSGERLFSCLVPAKVSSKFGAWAFRNFRFGLSFMPSEIPATQTHTHNQLTRHRDTLTRDRKVKLSLSIRLVQLLAGF